MALASWSKAKTKTEANKEPEIAVKNTLYATWFVVCHSLPQPSITCKLHQSE